MTQSLEVVLGALIRKGEKARNHSQFFSWRAEVFAFMRAAMDKHEFNGFSKETETYDEGTGRVRGTSYLEGLLVKRQQADASSGADDTTPSATDTKDIAAKVFVVHGHDSEHKEATARFLEKLGLTPVILHEQPNAGDTIIEKFEAHASVQFALILLTPDDTGAAKASKKAPKPRARQNVIFEFGYFIGALGRSRVCALYAKGVELPSDYQGVLYIPLDTKGAWKTKLAQEFVKASLNIDLKGLL